MGSQHRCCVVCDIINKSSRRGPLATGADTPISAEHSIYQKLSSGNTMAITRNTFLSILSALLAATQSLFYNHHNQLARQLKLINYHWDADRIFEVGTMHDGSHCGWVVSGIANDGVESLGFKPARTLSVDPAHNGYQSWERWRWWGRGMAPNLNYVIAGTDCLSNSHSPHNRWLWVDLTIKLQCMKFNHIPISPHCFIRG